MKKLLIAVAVLVFITLIFVIQDFKTYNIKDSLEAVEREIEHRLSTDIHIRNMSTVGNKRLFTYTMGDTFGSGELIRGYNNRYKFNYVGHGTSKIRERIIKTGKGQFLMLAGRNRLNIQHIIAHIEDEVYDVNIPEGEYYLVLTPVQPTKMKFTSGMILYNKENQVIERMKLP